MSIVSLHIESTDSMILEIEISASEVLALESGVMVWGEHLYQLHVLLLEMISASEVMDCLDWTVGL